MIRLECTVDSLDEYKLLKKEIEESESNLCMNIDVYCRETSTTYFYDTIEVAQGVFKYLEDK